MKNLLLLAALLASPAPAVEGPFLDLSFEEACTQAGKQGKLVFVDFFTTWCEPCKKLDRVTWKDPEVLAWLEQHTLPLKIDAEKERALAGRLSVKAYPTMVFVQPDGTLKGSIVGYRDPQEFLTEAKDVLAGVKRSDRLREALAEEPEDVNKKMDLARELVREGGEEEALELFLWCFDNGVDAPGFGGVRVSFLLGDIARLGASYPPAVEALRTRRDAVREIVLGPSPTFRATQDFTSINSSLKQPADTLAAHDELLARFRAAREKEKKAGGEHLRNAGEFSSRHWDPLPLLFDTVVPLLFKAERYLDIVDGFGEPLEWLNAEIKDQARLSAFMKDDDSFLSYRRKKTLTEGCWLYQALLGVGDQDALAGKLGTALVDYEPGVETWRALMKCAEKVERKDVQRSLREAALAVLPEEDHRRLRKVRD